MYDFYFDSGTTNSRAYLLEGEHVVHTTSAKIGSRDAALQNDNTVLICELRRMYEETLSHCKCTDTDVRRIVMSGMITCPHGLVEIEHLSTPVSCQKLAAAIVPFDEQQFFKRTIYLVPGIKTFGQGQKATLDTIEHVNNMRGEEIEIMGILRQYEALRQGRVIIVLPGSHTQVAFLQDGVIENISSNITGELYSALVHGTILSSSLTGEGNRKIHSDMVRKGYENLCKYGFNRALYIVRAMHLFTDASLSERRSYIEGVLNGGVMDAILSVVGDAPTQVAIAGSHTQYEVFVALAACRFTQLEVIEVPAQEDLPFSVEGMLYLYSQRQEMK